VEDDTIKIAVVGRPNAGKSTLVNRLLGHERVIVSNVAGTTRDAIDSDFESKGKKFTIIDTAGIRKNRDVEDVEYYSVLRSYQAIDRADIVFVIMDAHEISEQDVRICGKIHEANKPSVILINKWDDIEKDTFTVNKYNEKLQEDLKFMDYFVPIFISAKTGQRVHQIIPTALKILENAEKRITTGILNEILRGAIAVNQPPSKNGRRLKIYYATQTGVNPPSFAFFVNDPALVHFSYERYLENALRKSADFSGTPIKMFFKNKMNDG
jgi:GTP-binding protein